jgi:hypothetical protein
MTLRALVLLASLPALVACRGPSPTSERAAPDVPRAAPAVVFPHRPERCDYETLPPHAGHLRVSPHVEGRDDSSAVKNLHLTFVGDPSRSIVVQWSTDGATLASAVTVRDARGSGAARRVEGYSFPLLGEGGRRQHEVHLCGLEPGTRYEYAVLSGRGPATAHHFVTAPEGPSEVHVMVAGDARSDPAEWGRVSRRALARSPDLLLFTGDAVADGGSVYAWDEFFAEGAELLAEVPGVWADGNHEGQSAVYYDQFALPPNGGPKHHEHWYALTYGPLRVVVLNDSTVSEEEIAGAETDFLRDTLGRVDRARTPFVVTMHHKPMHTDALGHLPDALTLAAWGPLFDRFRVDLDLSGHVHNYESTEGLRGDRIDPEGTRYIVFGGAGAPLYGFRDRLPSTHQRESTHGFGMLLADARSLRWQAFRTDGSLIESLALRPSVPR